MVLPDHPDKIQAADMRQLDVGNHKIGREIMRGVECLAAVGHGLRLMTMRREQIAEQFHVEGIVLDDQDLGQLPSLAPSGLLEPRA